MDDFHLFTQLLGFTNSYFDKNYILFNRGKVVITLPCMKCHA